MIGWKNYAALAADQSFTIWDLETIKPIRTFDNQQPSSQLLREGPELASYSPEDQRIKFWDQRCPIPLATLTLPYAQTGQQIARLNQRLFSTAGNKLFLWDLRQRQIYRREARRLRLHPLFNGHPKLSGYQHRRRLHHQI